MEDDSPSNQAKIGQLVRRKEGWIWIFGNQISLFSAPRPKPPQVHQKERVQDQDQDQDDEQEHVRSPKPANSCKIHDNV